MKQLIQLSVNHQVYQEEIEPQMLLSFFLRECIGLTGTHVGCVVGECGACSVLLDGRLIKSCLLLAVQAHHKEITTVEGLAEDGTFHPLQEAFVKHYALQCGYCTPGMLLASHYLLTRNSDPNEEEVRRGLSGNLCMCTGYMQIVQAVKAAAKEYRK
ncbi:(2Fe-2S)-binding protein [Acidobacteria bacterium AH-259-D05]|nr:(2Fe-2S)-binding protein [Acidobacteria bacterium AH-259-D05]